MRLPEKEVLKTSSLSRGIQPFSLKFGVGDVGVRKRITVTLLVWLDVYNRNCLEYLLFFIFDAVTPLILYLCNAKYINAFFHKAFIKENYIKRFHGTMGLFP